MAVCAITGHFGYKQGREAGWPKLISNQRPAKRAVAERNAAYNVCPSKDKAIVNAIGSPHSWRKWYDKNKGKPGWIDFDGWLRSK